jgi:peptide/nickel transport system ATP-binding protein
MSVLGLLPPASTRVEGNILLEGRNLLGLDTSALREIRGRDVSMVFQEPMTSLNPVMTCGAQITESLQIHLGLNARAAKTEALRLLDRVRIPDAVHRFGDFPHQLSGGMRQRIMIAIALACNPRLVIADEPTTALDVTIQAQILDRIKELQTEEGMAVLFITHDMGVVAEISDRTVVMNAGEIVESGTTADIFHEPREPYTRALLSSVPRLGSMKGHSAPARFPIIDRETGLPVGEHEAPITQTPERKPLLKVEGLTTHFDLTRGFFGRVVGRVHAVENVSFDLAAGETLALVGESGCGKSTTGRSVLRMIDPQSGKVSLDGVNLMSLDRNALRAQKRHMQMIFQDPFSSLNPRRSVGESIAEPLLVNSIADRNEANEQVRSLMERVGLDPYSVERFPHEFSGGQRQRICIARALALGPKLIVADESVSALDVSVKAQVVNLMLDLQESLGIAFIFISHDMAVVERVSHRVAVMYLGEIVEIGSREAVFANPRHPYTGRLLSAVPVADPSQRQLRTAMGVEELPSPIRPPDYLPPKRSYASAGPDHLYMLPDQARFPGICGSWQAHKLGPCPGARAKSGPGG